MSNLTPFVEYFETSKFSTVYNIDLDSNFKDYKEKIRIKNKNHAYEIHRTTIKYEKLKETSKNLKITIQNSDNDLLDFEQIIEEKKISCTEKI